MATLTYPDAPFHDVMRGHAGRNPDAVAVVDGVRTVTYGEFDQRSDRLANGLAAQGLASGDRLALFLPNGLEYELSFFAASKRGAIVSPLNAAYRRFELTHQLNDSGASLIVTHQSLWEALAPALADVPGLKRIVVVGDTLPDGAAIVGFDEVAGHPNAAAPDAAVSPDQVVALPYSSGTTGRPKGVMLTHRNLVCNQVQFGSTFGFNAGDVFPVYLPLAHIYGVLLMGTATWAGASQILFPRFDLAALVQAIERYRVTWLPVVPPILLALANAPLLDRAQFRTVRFAMNAAAPLAPDVARAVENRYGFPIVQGYGLTETSPDTHVTPLDPERRVLESAGLPVPDTDQRIVDLETGERTLASGEVGEVVVRGPQVMKGYWNAPEETARVLRNDWLHTGDIGWIDARGYLFIVDRKKEMIKFKSFSIAPAELEALVLSHPDVADCAVVGVPDEEAGEVPKAFVVAKAGVELDFGALSTFVDTRVAGYKKIRQWEVRSSIPRTPSGKILRRALKDHTG